MTLFDFAKNNINRDKKNYIYYFVNCVFSVFVFFLFSMLSFHPAMRVIDKNSTMGLILVIGEVISIGFALCFISYSVSCFLKGRSRQLGVITILGASKKQLNRLIFMENMLVGIGSILSGILFGLVFAKMFLQVANKVIGVDQFDFYFPIKAIILTLVVLGVVFWMISYFTPKFVRRKTIVQLVKAEETGEKRQKLLPLLIAFFILAPIICWVMFSPSQMAVSARNNSLTLIPLGVTVCLMTYLIFALGMRLRIREKNKHSCNTHLLTVSNMRSGLKKNAQSMALTTILYGISFLAIILLFSASAHVLEETEKITPYAIMYNTWEETANAEEDVAIIHKELEELPNYKKMQFTLHKRQGENSRIAYMSATNYNQIMAFLGREKVGLTGDELYLVAGNAGTKWDKIPDEARQLLTGESGTPKLVGDSENTILLSGYVSGVCVVSDPVFAHIEGQLDAKEIYAFHYSDWQGNAQVVKKLHGALKNEIEAHRVNFVSAYDYYSSSKLQSNLTLYIGGILCFTFILAVASFIYSRLYSELDGECKKYIGIVKIGLSQKELSQVLGKHITMLLIEPFALAIVYLWCGILMVEKNMIISIIPTAIGCTVTLIALQAIFYIWIRSTYRKAVLRKVYGQR